MLSTRTAMDIDLDELASLQKKKERIEKSAWTTWRTLAEVDYLMRNSPGWVPFDVSSMKNSNCCLIPRSRDRSKIRNGRYKKA